MANNKVLITIVALFIGGIAGYTLNDHRHSFLGYFGHKGMMSSDQCHRGREVGNKTEMMGHDMHSQMVVTSEKDFLEGMIPHHEEAVITAKEVLARGATTLEVRTLVEAIIVAQEKEIVDMKDWYKAWYGTDYVANRNYTPMMRDLSKLSGQELDNAFLEDMIMHHMGAIMMARSIAPYTEHAEVKNLTKAILETQSAEIDTMKAILMGS